MTDLKIQMLGGFRVTTERGPLEDVTWPHRRAADLVKLLALAPYHRAGRDHVIDSLWPGLPREAGGNNLRKAVYHARRALQDEDAVGLEAGYVILCPRMPISTDVEEFEAAAAHALPSRDPDLCRSAAALFAGDLLPDDREELWVEPHAERLRATFRALLRASEQWERLVDTDPLDEEAHRELMKLRLSEGRRPEAFRQFETLRTLLREELGVGPDPETARVYEAILAYEGTESSNPAEHVNGLIAQALGSINRMELDQARAAAEDARSVAIALEMGRALGEASGILGMIAHMRGEWRSRFREEFEDVIYRSPSLAPCVFDAHLCFAEFSLDAARGHVTAAGFAQELLDVADAAASLPGRALATLMLGEAALLAGSIDTAELQIAAAMQMHQQAKLQCGHVLCLERLAQIDMARGRRAKASRRLLRALKLARGSSMSSHLCIRCYGGLVRAAEPESSLSVVEAGDRELRAQDICAPCSMTYRIGAAMACATLGHLDRAEKHLEDADRIAGMWRGGAWNAAVWEARARVRIARGDVRQGAALLEEAADLFMRLERPLDEARCRQAVALQAAGGQGTTADASS